MKRSAPQQAPEIQVEAQGQMPPDAIEYAQEKVPALAQANLDVDGRLARTHVAATTVTEAPPWPTSHSARRPGRGTPTGRP